MEFKLTVLGGAFPFVSTYLAWTEELAGLDTI